VSGGGTIYYPTGDPGPFAVISLSPGFIEQSGAFDLWGTRLASNGFVTVIFNTSNIFEDPSARSTEQRAALTYVVQQGGTSGSPLFGIVDGNRRGVAGHSMGGGATLISLQADHSLRAGMPFAPWDPNVSFSGITSPTLVYGCQSDSTAPVASNASLFYNSIPASVKKEYLSVAGGDHFCINDPGNGSGTVGKYAVAFFKKWLDDDSRYDPWTCGASKPTAGSFFNEVRTTCPW
jgi:predicted dienelactone hydrolase